MASRSLLDAPFLGLATAEYGRTRRHVSGPRRQIDRFMFMIELDYPSEEEEIEIARTTTGDDRPALDMGSKHPRSYRLRT